MRNCSRLPFQPVLEYNVQLHLGCCQHPAAQKLTVTVKEWWMADAVYNEKDIAVISKRKRNQVKQDVRLRLLICVLCHSNVCRKSFYV